MKTNKSYLERCHGRIGWLGASLLMLPILGWVWLVAWEPVVSVFNGAVPCYVGSGKLFSERFNTIHAGFTLDQPTIGKWLFWFTVMLVSSLPYATAVRWLSNRVQGLAYLAYAVCGLVLGVFLLCILSWPLSWLIQYVFSMGLTPRRIEGLLYAVAGGLLVIGFIVFALRRPNDESNRSTLFAGGGWRAVAISAAVLGLLVVWVNWRTWTGRYYCLKRIDHQRVTQTCFDLYRNTQFTNECHSIYYRPGQNWSSLPPVLRELDLQYICVSKHGLALRKTPEVNLGFMQSRTNAAVYELTLNGGRPPLYQINRETTYEPTDDPRR